MSSLRIPGLLKQLGTACMPLQLKISEKIFNLMADLDVCNRCMFRLVGIRDRSVHLNLDSSPSVPSKRSLQESENTCSVCVGLLQMDYSAIALPAMELLKEYKLKEKTFSLRMQFPPQLAIRNASIKRFLEEKLASDDQVSGALPDFIEIREIFRYLVADSFSNASGFKFDANSPFALVLSITHDETVNDYRFMVDIPELGFKVRKVKRKGRIVVEGASGEKIARSAEKLTFQNLLQAGMCPPPALKTHSSVSNISFWHDSIFLAGRYNKFQRHISNSAWIIDGKRLAEHSMEELIADNVTPYFKCEEKAYKFSSAGREDADVLMLGSGRPFYLELVNPKNLDYSQEEITMLEKMISESSNGMIGTKDLQIVDRESIKVLKDSASTKSKSYACRVKVHPPVSFIALKEISGKKNIMLDQRTPTRIPRRADLVRQKVIESISIIPHNKEIGEVVELLEVEMKTSAGTYVKEFVHGDNGRTTPNLVTLLNCDSAECLELDVTAVHLDWPPQVKKMSQNN